MQSEEYFLCYVILSYFLNIPYCRFLGRKFRNNPNSEGLEYVIYFFSPITIIAAISYFCLGYKNHE
jgi:hypothetical protein